MSASVATPNAYRESAVLSASPEVLVVMLFDGARRFLYQASVAMREGKIELSHRKLLRAENIIQHLRDALDFDQGEEIAHNLESIYVYCLRRVRQCRFDRDPATLEHVSTLLGDLREAFATVAQA
jgi:flagellar secretion chaperone FliS